MRIVIIGAGEVGFHVAKSLSELDYDIAVVDTNSSPDNIDYVIPGNDDSIRSISLFSRAVSDACLEGSKLATGLKPNVEEEKGPAIIRSKSKKDEKENEAPKAQKEEAEAEETTAEVKEEKPEPKAEESVEEDNKEEG